MSAISVMSVFDPESFAQPSNDYWPLQIIHGFDGISLDVDPRAAEEDIDRRLSKLKNMGIGGIVTNVSFEDYLMNEQGWDRYRHVVQRADEMGLVLWLYDEKGYPSGTAGGIVTRAHPEYVALGLACYTNEVVGPIEMYFDLPVSCQRFVWAGALPDPDMAVSETVVNLTSNVDSRGTLRWHAPSGKWTVLYLAERVMYEGTHAANNVFEFKQYVNLLQPEAVREFLRVTHERYVRETPPQIWKHIRAIFTDEPSFMTTYMPPLPERFLGQIPVIDAPLFTDRPAAVPWSEDLLARFQAMKGYDLRPHLFALFTSASEEACYVRQDYYDVITHLYTEAFYKQVLDWCQAHGVASSGHVLGEESIMDHVAYQGSLFSVIRQMDLPGIDMLNSDSEDMLTGLSFMTAKQVSSAAHLTGRRQIHSECSDWVQGNAGRRASLAERRGQGNLLYVLGINQVTAYWDWDEIGEAGYRDYNDYMGRLASLLTEGHHCCDVAVLYPIRSACAHFVPVDRPLWHRELQDNQPVWLHDLTSSYPNLVRNLLRSQIDLDIIDEEAITTGEVHDGALVVANEKYRAVVLPSLYALGLDAAGALRSFVHAGGLLVSVDRLPALAESPTNTALLCEELLPLFGDRGRAYTLTQDSVVSFLRSHLKPDFTLDERNDNILYTHRRLQERDVYFIINNAPLPTVVHPELQASGPYTAYRPLTGKTSPADLPLALELDGYEGVFVVSRGDSLDSQ